MKKQLIIYIKKKGLPLILSIALPAIILAIVYARMGIYHGSERTVMASDMFSQHANFYASFQKVLSGEQSPIYSWFGSMGLNYWTLTAYYLGGIFTPLIGLFDANTIPDGLYWLILLKIGCMGGTFWVLADQTFELSQYKKVLLSLCYALMSYSVAFSEMIMWLDILIYLPLAVLGIHQIINKRKPVLLFVIYVLMFVSNYYLAFMAGIFTLLYFLLKVIAERSWRSIAMYLYTSFTAGGVAMIVILPSVLDLKNNGEALTPVSQFLKEDTTLWGIVLKNMVGFYDTTKFGGAPFIYVGLFPLLLCLLYFFNSKISRRQKGVFAGLFLLLIAGVYLEPLNLFFHGMHAPNMFLFRFSFLFSFFVIFIAGYSWELYSDSELNKVTNIVLALLGLFMAAKFFVEKEYKLGDDMAFVYTMIFLILYLLIFTLKQKKGRTWWLAVLLSGVIFTEVGLNTTGMVTGIWREWNYPSRSLYTEPREDIQSLVAKSQEEGSFQRLENLDSISSNDSFNFGYSGISMFSSVRNRRTSLFLHSFGFRSFGTQLKVAYDNNTLLADTLLSVKYNIAKQDPMKFGYEKKAEQGKYQLYENQYALPLSILTDKMIYSKTNQADLLSQLGKVENSFFDYVVPEVKDVKNTVLTHGTKEGYETLIFTAEDKNQPQIITWEAIIPAKTQAYFDLYPVSYTDLNKTTIEMKCGDNNYKTKLAEASRYYRLGIFEQEQKVTFQTIVTGSERLELFQSDVVALKTDNFAQAVTAAQKNGKVLNISGNQVTGTVKAAKDQVLFTTIPYDQGWTAHVNGKKVTIKPYQEALITIPLVEGENNIQFHFIPVGFVAGIWISLISLFGFLSYIFYLKWRRASLED